MADVYKYFVGLRLLLVIVMVLQFDCVTSGMRSRFHRQEYPVRDKYQWHEPERITRYILNRTLRAYGPYSRNVQTGQFKIRKAVTAQTGSEAILPCNSPEIDESMVNITVEWFKRNNISRDILTFWNETVVDDKRFLATNASDGKDWSLHIRYTQSTDAGLYQCQICWNDTSDTCINSNVSLSLVEAHAKIFDGPTKVIPNDKDLPLRLSCVLINSIEAPDYIFWYHGDRMINYDLEDGATVREGRHGSELIFPKPNRTHAGNYSCVPSNAMLDSIMVYYGSRSALSGSEDGSGSGKKSQPQDDIVNMLVLISTFQLFR